MSCCNCCRSNSQVRVQIEMGAPAVAIANIGAQNIQVIAQAHMPPAQPAVQLNPFFAQPNPQKNPSPPPPPPPAHQINPHQQITPVLVNTPALSPPQNSPAPAPLVKQDSFGIPTLHLPKVMKAEPELPSKPQSPEMGRSLFSPKPVQMTRPTILKLMVKTNADNMKVGQKTITIQFKT